MGRLLFEAKDAERWLDAIGDLPDVADRLRNAGLAPESSHVHVRIERGFVERLPLFKRVSCGEITAERAADELWEMLARQLTGECGVG